MSRIEFAGNLISALDGIKSVLDVGCRDGALKSVLPSQVEYFGSDLLAANASVRYVGDFNSIEFDRRFDAIVALDVLEHMEHPSRAFDKMGNLSSRYIITSLPNCYDLRTRAQVAFGGRMGGKYEFSVDEPLDRHRWVMGFGEIVRFYQSKATSLGLDLRVVPMKYGAGRNRSARNLVGKILAQTLPATLTAVSVIGVFERTRYAASE